MKEVGLTTCDCRESIPGQWVDVIGRWPLMLPSHRAARPEWPWWEATRLAHMHHRLSALVEHRPVIFDIGAEEGDFPALWSTWGCDVVAVEPNPKVWPNIRAVWDMNDLRPMLGHYVGFCGPETDECPPNLSVDATVRDGWPECAYAPVIGDHGFRHLSQEADATPTVTLDDLVERLGIVPDAITMDVEGSELEVLRGARRTLTEHRPLVWVSVHPEFMAEMHGATPHELFDLMDGLDYQRLFLASDHEDHHHFFPRESRDGLDASP